MAYSAPDYGGYTRRQGDVDYKYSQDAAQNAYGRFLGQQRFERDRSDDSRNFGRSYPGYSASFAQRGVGGPGVDSGIMREQMGRYVGDYARDQSRAYQDQTLRNQQYDLQQANLDQWRAQALTDIETDKANDIAWTAQNLSALRELLGGL